MYNHPMNNKYYMWEALKEAQKSIEEGGLPFSVIVVDRDGNIAWRDHDRVQEYMDPTAHGEINIIRKLCKDLNTLDLSWYIFYTSSEPCPTCLSACIKAHVQELYYWAETESTASLPIKAIDLAKYSEKYPIKVVWWILWKECLEQRSTFFTL